MARVLCEAAGFGVTDRGGARRDPLRVLMVFHSLGLGGAEAWLLALIKEFKRLEGVLPRPVRVDVCLTGAPIGEFYDQIRNEGVGILHVPFGRRSFFAFARSFRNLLSRGAYDVVHDHQDVLTGLHLLPGIGVLPPCRVAHVHNPVLHSLRYRRGGLRKTTFAVSKWLLKRLATRVLGTSDEVLRAYGLDRRAYAHLRPRPLYCGVDFSRFRGNREECRRKIREEMGLAEGVAIVLFVGRLDAGKEAGLNQKNPEFALQVAEVLYKSRPQTALLMAGVKPPDPMPMEAWIRERGLAGVVRLLGPRTDVPELMLAADLLLFPSLAEGLGMVAVEAQAAGLPVLASDRVPTECAVIRELATFLPLELGPSAWAREAEALINRPRSDADACNQKMARSAFAIEQSALRLLEAYECPSESRDTA